MCADLTAFRLAARCRGIIRGCRSSCRRSPSTTTAALVATGNRRGFSTSPRGPTRPRPAGRILKRLQEAAGARRRRRRSLFSSGGRGPCPTISGPARCAGLSRGRSRRCDWPTNRRHSITCAGSSSSSSIRYPRHRRTGTGRRTRPAVLAILAKAGRRTRRSLCQRVGRTPAGHRCSVGGVAPEYATSVAFARDKDAKLASVVNAPNADIYVIEVSFEAVEG